MSASPLRVAIVDDVALARQRLERLLRGWPDVTVVASCADVDAATAAVALHAPDLLLLDVDMPGADGFALLDRLPADARPAVVFTTAHAGFAARAFRVDAVDYLLKPVSAEALGEALERVATRRRAGRDTPAWLVLREREGTTLVPMAAIDWVEAAGNYACIRADGTTHVHRETLTRLEARLDPALFQRIHRSRLVNVAKIASLRPLANGDHVVVLRDGTELGLSRTWRDALYARLQG
ncbi:LytR/AlgR family response regulator transcription factor [Arenimonas composti]|uniref:Uncharacterized protein n=1 Tax=Arenimonas composti TR7-09 = DSM 18010 TaxID=1121013 RepID=A0A091BDW8_9GAMM|nr:LytTR family DNA-binding domain-containing protein [Arenimonas composti]KFN48984.1 hypothetical protein P873_12625 [Arenimonas composti TR7-09 = DSM 18010]